jgi:hypothetical protein
MRHGMGSECQRALPDADSRTFHREQRLLILAFEPVRIIARRRLRKESFHGRQNRHPSARSAG